MRDTDRENAIALATSYSHLREYNGPKARTVPQANAKRAFWAYKLLESQEKTGAILVASDVLQKYIKEYPHLFKAE